MLVEFTVRNFRSIKDEQTLNLAAGNDRSTIHKNLAPTNVLLAGKNGGQRVLASAAILGANASGKSNLVSALQSMRDMVAWSPGNLTEPGFIAKPFLFDEETMAAPTKFEATVLIDGLRYQYGFEMTPERIVSERLLVYRTKKPQQLFARKFNKRAGKDVISVQEGLRGPKQTWIDATRPKALFLSVATMLNCAEFKPVVDWFATQCLIVNERERLTTRNTEEALDNGRVKQDVLWLLNSADISIKDITVEKGGLFGDELYTDPETDRTWARPVSRRSVVTFHHQGGHGDVQLDLSDESSGTRAFFALAVPLLDIFKSGKTMVVDELDNSLHPILIRELIWLFHNPELNTGKAQLIFTTHDATLLDAVGLFRPDQIWLTEKRIDQSTELYSLAKFNMSEIKNTLRNYFSGRYGGIPFVDFNHRSTG